MLILPTIHCFDNHSAATMLWVRAMGPAMGPLWILRTANLMLISLVPATEDKTTEKRTQGCIGLDAVPGKAMLIIWQQLLSLSGKGMIG